LHFCAKDFEAHLCSVHGVKVVVPLKLTFSSTFLSDLGKYKPMNCTFQKCPQFGWALWAFRLSITKLELWKCAENAWSHWGQQLV